MRFSHPPSFIPFREVRGSSGHLYYPAGNNSSKRETKTTHLLGRRVASHFQHTLPLFLLPLSSTCSSHVFFLQTLSSSSQRTHRAENGAVSFSFFKYAKSRTGSQCRSVVDDDAICNSFSVALNSYAAVCRVE